MRRRLNKLPTLRSTGGPDCGGALAVLRHRFGCGCDHARLRRRFGKAARDLSLHELRQRQHQRRGADAGADEGAAAQPLAPREVVGHREERQVVNRGDPRQLRKDGTGESRREEHVEPGPAQRPGKPHLLEPGAAACGQRDDARAARVPWGEVGGGRVREQGQLQFAIGAPSRQERRQIAASARGPRAELARVDADAQGYRPSVSGPRPACRSRGSARQRCPNRTRGCARGRLRASAQRACGRRGCARCRAQSCDTSSGFTSIAAPPATSSSAEPRGADDRQPRGHRLGHRQAEALLERGQHEGGGRGHQGADLARLEVAGGVDAGRSDDATRGPVAAGPDQDERRHLRAATREPHVRHRQVHEVLALLFAADVEEGAARQAVAAQHALHLLRCRRLAVGGIDAVRDHRDLARRAPTAASAPRTRCTRRRR